MFASISALVFLSSLLKLSPNVILNYDVIDRAFSLEIYPVRNLSLFHTLLYLNSK